MQHPRWPGEFQRLVSAASSYHAGVVDPAEFVAVQRRGQRAWLRVDLAAGGAELCDACWAPLEPLADAKGRGGVGVLRLGGLELVVRPYRRGGAIGSLLKDRYLRPGRVRDELALLASLRREGVPVVVPVAGVARRRGAFWQLRLLTERLPGALPVPAFLAANPALRRHCAEAVGVLVRLAFAAGLDHPDFHLDNVLCVARGDRVRAVLVDLDRAALRRPLPLASQERMLARLQRHLVRHRAKLAAVPTRAETLRFLRALGLSREARRETIGRLAAAVTRQLRRRDWLRSKR